MAVWRPGLMPLTEHKTADSRSTTGYMKAVKAALQEAGKSEAEVKEFETGAQKFVKERLLTSFKDWEFYTGESMNPDGM